MARRWDREAAREGVRRRVFCLSIGDVFEKHPTLIEPRRRLLNLIPTTTHLDWLLLTKRPENAWGLGEVWNGSHIWPDNVWLGTTCENQEEAERRIPHLATIPAKVKFLSCEPLLGPLNLFGPALNDTGPFGSAWTKRCVQYSTDYGAGTEYDVELTQAVDWVIVGSESGPGARPMDISWARSLVEQCRDAKVPCFVKQIANEHDKKGGDPKHWPPGPGGRPWPREFPS
jgi:protein gp37